MLVSPPTIVAVFLVATVVGPVLNEKKQDGSLANQAVSTQTSTNALPKYPYTDLLKFTDENYEEAFKSLDLNNDHLIKFDDLKSHYYHKDSAFAVQKFIELLDTPNPNSKNSIDFEEFKMFMNKDTVKLRTYGITTLQTPEYRKRYYADEILSYVYLVLDKNAIRNLFDSLETNKDEKIDYNEVKGMEAKLMNGNQRYKLTEAQVTVIMAEMGGSSREISFKDFENYLQDWKLVFLFRDCRLRLIRGGAEYDNLCLVRKLIRYTTRYLTEYMTTLVFDSLEGKTKDRKVSVEDIEAAFSCKEKKKAEYFISFLGGKNDVLEYGEFRELFQLPVYDTFYGSECSTEKDTDIAITRRIECMKWKIWNVVDQKFFPRYVGIPDLDLIFLFEDLDTTDDGTIEQRKDLEVGKGWQSKLARKFMEEVGSPETKEKVNLDDFFRYAYEPYMMCALAECQLVKDKMTCYNGELEDVITHVLTDSEVLDFFSIYTSKKPSPSSSTTTTTTTPSTDNNQENNQDPKKEVISDFNLRELYPHMSKETMDIFFSELGMGDRYVHLLEFKFYVKQQEPGHVFSIEDKSVPRQHFAANQLHDKLMSYIERFMTEYDIFSLFQIFDIDGNGVINIKDIQNKNNKDTQDAKKQEVIIDADLLARIAVYGNKEQATIQELWLFLNSKASGREETRKRLLEKDCAQLNQKKEITCFASKLKSLK